MEGLAVMPEFWRGKRVFVTGHTGFKGGWLSLWLHAMGAEVHGYALDAPTEPAFFSVAGVGNTLASHVIADIRDANRLRVAVEAARPEVVFHLAAQSLVRTSYASPADTYAINVMGTVHLLDAVRAARTARAVVNVTTDKCYENREWLWPYRENEAMGGADPYSSSKGCAELVTDAYRRSFLDTQGIHVASARAGNVIGGGDWAQDRLLPDFLRALDAGQTLDIRSPDAVRPWQHVLEPLSGYLALAQRLHAQGRDFAEAWNFGPSEDDARPVRWIVERMVEMRNEVRWRIDGSPRPHEAHYLRLDSSKARARLGWKPRWPLLEGLRKTVQWHEAWCRGDDMRSTTLAQIADYTAPGTSA